MLVGRLTQLGTEEDKIISKGNDAVRESSENLKAAAGSFR
jgi:hypothetical protein